MNLSNCKYDVLRIVQKKLGWKEVGEEDDWQLTWTDMSVSIERVMKLKSTQKINHFHGMLEICRKKPLARNIARMAKDFPKAFNFVPKSWVLPEQSGEFLAQISAKKKHTYILKPDNGCQGKGIHLVQTAGRARQVMDSYESNANVVAQRYLAKPFLIDGLKFDMRIYVVVISCDPLRVFIHKDGLVRFCTEPYQAPSADNIRTSCMHLTNYSLNKHNENFQFNEDAENDGEGSKWGLGAFRKHLEDEGHDYGRVWAQIEELSVKTLISIQPILAHNYWSVLPPDNDGYSCFEVLGLDIMLDHKLKPWLVEVNHSPSFGVDTPLDMQVKGNLISDTINLVRINPSQIKKAQAEEKKQLKARLYSSNKVQKKNFTAEEILAIRQEALRKREAYEQKHMGRFVRIYPSPDPGKQEEYDLYLEACREHFQSSFQSKVTAMLGKMKEHNQKKAADEAAREQAELERKEKLHALAQKASLRARKASVSGEVQEGPPRAHLPPPAGGGSWKLSKLSKTPVIATVIQLEQAPPAALAAPALHLDDLERPPTRNGRRPTVQHAKGGSRVALQGKSLTMNHFPSHHFGLQEPKLTSEELVMRESALLKSFKTTVVQKRANRADGTAAYGRKRPSQIPPLPSALHKPGNQRLWERASHHWVSRTSHTY